MPTRKPIVNNKHLTIEDRTFIQKAICNGAEKTAIARSLGKDPSTIGKEIKSHRFAERKCYLKLECANYKQCKYNRDCTESCPGYTKFKCTRRDRSPGACNGCSNHKYCRFTIYKYDAGIANGDYKRKLSDCRKGVNLTTSEARDLGNIVKKELYAGKSPYVIKKIHSEIKVSERTIYNYVNNDVFWCVNLYRADLRRAVSYNTRHIKDGHLLKKRNDYRYLLHRKYEDYLSFIDSHPNTRIVQMDTVYNDITNGPFIQTFQFVDCKFLFAILHNTKTSNDMVKGVDLLEDILSEDIFKKYCEVIITDRGSEFTNADRIEVDEDGVIRTKVFYCDPMQACQKGAIENQHRMLRYICPKEKDLHTLGLNSQDALNVVLSNINSCPVESLSGKSPIEMMRFLHPDLWDRFNTFGIQEIDPKDIILKPSLLKQFR